MIVWQFVKRWWKLGLAVVAAALVLIFGGEYVGRLLVGLGAVLSALFARKVAKVYQSPIKVSNPREAKDVKDAATINNALNDLYEDE